MRLRRPMTVSLVVVGIISLGLSSGLAAAQASAPPGADCDQECLSRVMKDFLSAMTTGKAATVPLADAAEVRENTKIVTLDATAWKQVKAIRSLMTVADPLTGNVVSRAGVELSDGKPGYSLHAPEAVGRRPDHRCRDQRRHLARARRTLRVEPPDPKLRRYSPPEASA